MRDVHGDARSSADFHSFFDAFQRAARITYVRDIDTLLRPYALCGCGQLAGVGKTLVDIVESGRKSACTLTHALSHKLLEIGKLVVVGMALAKTKGQRTHIGVRDEGGHVLRSSAVQQAHVVGNASPTGVLFEAQTVERA